MSTGLPVSRLINVTAVLVSGGAVITNINSMMVLGDSDVIDVQTRIRPYSDLDSIAIDFDTTSPEYLAAVPFFAQTPQPNLLYIGRWARTAVNGRFICGDLTQANQNLSRFTVITSGGFKIKVDGGTLTNISGINLSAVTSLDDVATAITTALSGASIGATCVWDGQRFTFISGSTGTSSKVEPLQAPTSGTDLRNVLSAVTGAREVDGIAAETILAAVTIIDALPTYWYALALGVTAAHMPSTNNLISVSDYIEAASLPHAFGFTTQDPNTVDPASTADFAYIAKQAGYKRTWLQYSSTSPYAMISALARLITIDFNANKSMISLMYKGEPTILPETLTTAQADALDAKRCNYFVNYNNDTAIFQSGYTCGDAWIDEIFGIDYLRLRIQNDVYNLLYTSSTKVQQTDQGMNDILTVIEGSCEACVNNGLLAPGTWNAPGFGQLQTGDFMPKGYYVYAPLISAQATSDRGARKSVAFQVAAKLAGAVNTVDVLVTVNR